MKKLTTKEQQKYIAIKEYISGKITRKQASVRLGVTLEAVSRMKKGYQEEGKEYFSHGNNSNSNARRIDPELERAIVRLYKQDFSGFNFTHFRECLLDFRLIEPSRLPSQRSIANILERNGIRSPAANRVRRDPNPHPIRPRREKYGDLVQIDASQHDWLGLGPDNKITLHSSIDDATSGLLSGHFEKHETLHGYFRITKDILEEYGIPDTFYADKRTIFEYMTKHKKEQSRIHFKTACDSLGIDILTTSSPQAKGRVERLFRTLQDRLLSEMRYYNITSIEEANLFLPDYIRRHNEKFKLKSASVPNGFKPLSYEQRTNLDRILSIRESRRVLSGNIISFEDKQYMPVDDSNHIVKLPLNDVVEVLRTLSGDLLLLHDSNYYPLAWTADGRFTGHTPPKTHPWKAWRGE